jgi:hypothetical protein
VPDDKQHQCCNNNQQDKAQQSFDHKSNNVAVRSETLVILSLEKTQELQY